MIQIIQLKEVLRNKHFLLFTVFIPIVWYVMMTLTAKSGHFFTDTYGYIWFMASCLMGVAGNSIVTFSKRMNNGRRYYVLQSKISHYTLWRFGLDQLVVQIILNAMICLVVVICGIVLQTLLIDAHLLLAILLVTTLGIYFSIIGFSLGLLLSGQVLDAIGFPIMIVIAILIVPFSTIAHDGFVQIISTIQMLFPGYHLYRILLNLISGVSIQKPILYFFVSMIGTSLPFIWLTWLRVIKKTNALTV